MESPLAVATATTSVMIVVQRGNAPGEERKYGFVRSRERVVREFLRAPMV